MIIATVYIEPHERYEAIEAYRSRLTDAQVEEIEDAPEGALIRLTFESGQASVLVIEEG